MKILVVLTFLFGAMSSQYAPGAMRDPIYNRVNGLASPTIRRDHARFDGYAASRSPDLINSVLFVCPTDRDLPCRRLLIVDCAGTDDGTLEWIDEGNIGIEVDYETAVAWDTVGYGIPVDVYLYNEGPAHKFE